MAAPGAARPGRALGRRGVPRADPAGRDPLLPAPHLGIAHIDETLWAYDVLTTRVPGAEHAPLHFLSANLFSADIHTVYEQLACRYGCRTAYAATSPTTAARRIVGARPNWHFSVFPTGALPYFEVPGDSPTPTTASWRRLPERTRLREIHRLPDSSRMRASSGRLSSRRHWKVYSSAGSAGRLRSSTTASRSAICRSQPFGNRPMPTPAAIRLAIAARLLQVRRRPDLQVVDGQPVLQHAGRAGGRRHGDQRGLLQQAA